MRGRALRAAEHDPRSDRLDLRREPTAHLVHDRVLQAAHRDGAGRVRARPRRHPARASVVHRRNPAALLVIRGSLGTVLR